MGTAWDGRYKKQFIESQGRKTVAFCYEKKGLYKHLGNFSFLAYSERVLLKIETAKAVLGEKSMSKYGYRLVACCLAVILAVQISLGGFYYEIRAEEEQQSGEISDTLIEAPAGVLMEAETGTVLYAKDKDTRRSPASITKIMTLILIFDAIKAGKLHMNDEVTVSAYAQSMGGSQVYLEEGEKQTVETMIKCIVIASGNDASVAMAEHIAGSEGEFVKKMNDRARELGMENTHFEDCCGLTESENHYTSAYDVAVMSRELITKYPDILKYSSIWMDTIIHETRNGSSEFGLTNTNRMVRTYDGCVGLKTGSTSIAKYCVSAVARKNGITLIAVVMAAPDYKVRFSDAAAMLNSGFASCSLYVDKDTGPLEPVTVKRGKKQSVSCAYDGDFIYLDTQGNSLDDIKKQVQMQEEVTAPVQAGSPAGEVIYTLDGERIGSRKIVFTEDVEKADFLYYLKYLVKEEWFLNRNS